MRTKGYASLVIVGIAAFATVYALTTFAPQQQNLYSAETDLGYLRFVSKYGKSYETKEEFLFRQEMYKNALQAISQVNSQNDNTFRLAPNKFADWTAQEYRAMLGYKQVESGRLGQDGTTRVLPTDNLPTEKDWRKEGAVNEVQNQAKCGSCWTFSAAAAIEGHHMIKNKQLLKLSEQQFVDCCKIGPSDGCNGGEMWGAFECAKTNASMLESDYPYTSGAGVYGDCKNDPAKGKVTVSAWWKVTDNSPAQLKAAIAQGPVSVAIQADTIVFQYYAGGILSSPLCGTTLDHGVVALGYGVENGREFYIVRNSWGPDWGDKGYIRLGITEGRGVCGIQMASVWPEVK